MADLFASGRVVDCIVALMVMEFIGLTLLRKKSPSGLSTEALLANLAAGAALLMALRAALTGRDWQSVAIWLGVSLLAHVVDLKLRWSRTLLT